MAQIWNLKGSIGEELILTFELIFKCWLCSRGNLNFDIKSTSYIAFYFLLIFELYMLNNYFIMSN